VAPAEKIATSSPVGSAVSAFSTVICSPRELDGGARAARAGEEAELGERDVTLDEECADDGADLSGGADDAEADGLVRLLMGFMYRRCGCVTGVRAATRGGYAAKTRRP
jgi:hypothetical protein